MICAIHQPNFFPWLGYFDKISRADVFVFLNQVDYEKSGKSMQCYTNRVAILKNKKPSWIHCPVIREHGAQSICSVRISDELDWRSKIKKAISECYKYTGYFNEMAEFVYSLLDFKADFLSEYNIHNIKEIAKVLELDTKFVSQNMYQTTEHASKLLIELVKFAQCDYYLFGSGGKKYQQNDLFEAQGIGLIEQNYQQPKYQQISTTFVPGLSILDVLFNCGIDKTKEILHSKKG